MSRRLNRIDVRQLDMAHGLLRGLTHFEGKKHRITADIVKAVNAVLPHIDDAARHIEVLQHNARLESRRVSRPRRRHGLVLCGGVAWEETAKGFQVVVGDILLVVREPSVKSTPVGLVPWTWSIAYNHKPTPSWKVKKGTATTWRGAMYAARRAGAALAKEDKAPVSILRSCPCARCCGKARCQ